MAIYAWTAERQGARIRFPRNNQAPVDSTAVLIPEIFDHVVRGVSDLPALSGSNYNLTSGSWAFPTDLDLAGNVIRVPAGVTVFLKGYGPNRVVTGTGANTLNVDGGTAYVESLSLRNTVAQCLNLASSPLTRLLDCTLTSTSATNHTVSVTGNTSVLQVLSCTVTGGGGANTAAIRILTANDVCVINGSMHQSGGGSQLAVIVAGNITRGLRLANMFVDVNGLLSRTSGTVGSVHVIGNTAKVSGAGITWAAADMPTRGMLIVGNDFSTLTPFSGFTATSARVNAKANSFTSGLLTETPIVP